MHFEVLSLGLTATLLTIDRMCFRYPPFRVTAVRTFSGPPACQLNILGRHRALDHGHMFCSILKFEKLIVILRPNMTITYIMIVANYCYRYNRLMRPTHAPTLIQSCYPEVFGNAGVYKLRKPTRIYLISYQHAFH